jgi:hypothetical protein
VRQLALPAAAPAETARAANVRRPSSASGACARRKLNLTERLTRTVPRIVPRAAPGPVGNTYRIEEVVLLVARLAVEQIGPPLMVCENGSTT